MSLRRPSCVIFRLSTTLIKARRKFKFDRFRHAKGAAGGNTSSIYYAAYCFFEKLRIAEGKSKSTYRGEMDTICVGQGVDIQHASDRGVFVFAGETPLQDQYGRIFCRQEKLSPYCITLVR